MSSSNLKNEIKHRLSQKKIIFDIKYLDFGFNNGSGTFTCETCALKSRGRAALLVIPELHVHVFFNVWDSTFYFKNNNSKNGMM